MSDKTDYIHYLEDKCINMSHLIGQLQTMIMDIYFLSDEKTEINAQLLHLNTFLIRKISKLFYKDD